MALNTVGIVCALASEARHLGPTVRLAEPVGSLPDGTLVATTGMGRSAAAAGARALITAGAGALASWGMAGGLDPSLAAGAILLPTEVVGIDGSAHPCEAGWRSRLSSTITAQTGRLLTSAKAVGSVEDKAALFRSTRAVAVDMESAAIAEVAEEHGLPFIAVRVVVDSAADVLPRAVTAAADNEGHLHIWRLIGALALAPNELAPLIQLARRYRAANRSLAAIARKGSLALSAFPSPA
ncbi:MAG: purine and other phosphorylase-like protein, family 1 [Proteobacteria bacterium]|nr:purine and other phosphorylase-like protein, family 1 [Pseudomonadota bacterium]